MRSAEKHLSKAGESQQTNQRLFLFTDKENKAPPNIRRLVYPWHLTLPYNTTGLLPRQYLETAFHR